MFYTRDNCLYCNVCHKQFTKARLRLALPGSSQLKNSYKSTGLLKIWHTFLLNSKLVYKLKEN